jgi:hypothetical protein
LLFRERFTKFQQLDVLHRPSVDLCRTSTSSSRDSGIPIPSPSSSYRSSISEKGSPQESVFEFYLHPPHVRVHLDNEVTPMSYMYDSTPRSQPNRRSVHWNDEYVDQQSPSSRKQTINQDDLYNSYSTTVNKRGQRISLNASLPFHTKLNIRIHDNRAHSNETNEVKATANIQRLDPQREDEYNNKVRRAYFDHYSTASPNESINTTSRRDSPVQHNSFPRHYHYSVPIDQRLILYIRNGEVFARC